jgi:predicted peptidase
LKKQKNLALDPHRIYITGLSIGSFGTYDAISRYPNVIAAAVTISGEGDPKQAVKFSHIPLRVFHGVLDDVVFPAYLRDMLMVLSTVGAYAGYAQYPEAGHFACKAAFSDPIMMQWLFRQRKGK